MKNKLLTMMLILSTAFLTNCAKSSDNSTAAATAPAAVGSCPAGQVYTQYNCQPQTAYCTQNYGPNYGQYNGACYPATSASPTPPSSSACPAGQVGTARGCLPQNTCPAGYGYEYGYYNNQLGGWCYPQTY